jgi:tetratricopeptide (TPR) repeat protein
MSHWYPVLVVILLAAMAAPAGAQSQAQVDREARNLFEAGQEAFGTGSYERALDYFERAYALSHRSGLLYNIAVTADRMRNDARALEAFREYLSAEPETERRAEVEARIQYLEAARAEAGADVEPPPAEPVAPVEPPASGGMHPATLATFVAAGVLFASFGVFAALSEVEDQALAGRCGRDVGARCAPSDVGTLQIYNAVADVSWITGTAAAVAALVLFFVLPAEAAEAPVALAPWATPDGAGATGVLRW